MKYTRGFSGRFVQDVGEYVNEHLEEFEGHELISISISACTLPSDQFGENTPNSLEPCVFCLAIFDDGEV